jgi:hypothetical protein
LRKVSLALAPFVCALLMFGCGQSTGPVQLLTGTGGFDQPACYDFSVTGSLIVDPSAGTAIVPESGGAKGTPEPLMWPLGYTAQRLASGQIEVLAPDGKSVATTGRRYTIVGGGKTAFLACAAIPQ